MPIGRTSVGRYVQVLEGTYKCWKVELRSYQVVMRHICVVGQTEGITSTEKCQCTGLLFTRLQWKP